MTDTREVARQEPGGQPRRNPLARLALFVRQVVAELRKVVYPTQRRLITYTIVVLIFVAIILTFRGDKIVHDRRIYDFTRMLMQLGVLRAKTA